MFDTPNHPHPNHLPEGEGNRAEIPPLPPPVDVRLTVLPTHPCPYLSDRVATLRAFSVGRLPAELYHDFMDAGFRRSGRMVYQPVCAGCRRCIPLRVPVATFRPNKSQRRCERRNADLLVSVAAPAATAEKFDLYRRYVLGWHENRTAAGQQRETDVTEPAFESFLYDSPVTTIEFEYRHPANQQLLAVGLCDVSRSSLSSVYFYFDPSAADRGLGTCGALKELAWAQAANIPYYYLGYWVSGCGAMQYKQNFEPFECLDSSGNWCSPERS